MLLQYKYPQYLETTFHVIRIPMQKYNYEMLLFSSVKVVQLAHCEVIDLEEECCVYNTNITTEEEVKYVLQ